MYFRLSPKIRPLLKQEITLSIMHFSQADTNNRDVHTERAVPQHTVLHLAGGALAAGRRRHHATHRRADQAIRYVTHRTLG